MTRGKINSRGIVVDYACGREEYRTGVTGPREIADYSDAMSRNCEFKQHEVDAITHWQGLPDTHGDGTLYKISEMVPAYYYEAKREDQRKRLLYLDQLLRLYPERRIEGYDYEAIREAREMRERGEEKEAVEVEVRGVETIEITEIKEYPPCCDVIKVK